MSARATRVYCTNGKCQNVGSVPDAREYDETVNDHGEALCVPCAAKGGYARHDPVRPFEPVKPS